MLHWLDTKLILTNSNYDTIKRCDLYKYIIIEYYNNLYYENIHFVKQVLKIYFMHPTKEQDCNTNFIYVKI